MEKAVKEIRLVNMRALNDEEGMIVEGYAAVFDTVADLGWIKEVIDRTGSILELINILFVYFSFYNIPIIDWIKKEEDYSSS